MKPLFADRIVLEGTDAVNGQSVRERLEKAFEAKRERLEAHLTKLVRSSRRPKDTLFSEFKELVETSIAATTQEVHADVQTRLDWMKKNYERAVRRHEAFEAHLDTLDARIGRHFADAEDKRPPWVYLSLYAIFLAAMFITSASTAGTLMQELGWLVWFVAFSAIGGSFFISQRFKLLDEREPQRHFIRRLAMIGIVSFVAYWTLLAAGRGLANAEMAQQLSANDLFSTQTSSVPKWLPLTRLLVTSSMFLSLGILEITLSAGIYITALKQLRPRIDEQRFETSRRELGKRIDQVKDELEWLTAEIEQLESFGQLRKTWADETRQLLCAKFDIAYEEAHGTALDALLQMATGLSTPDILGLSQIVERTLAPPNGPGTSPAEKGSDGFPSA